MNPKSYPEDLPTNLRAEYDKYVSDPKRYQKLHPVGFKVLSKYIGKSNGKESKSQRRTS